MNAIKTNMFMESERMLNDYFNQLENSDANNMPMPPAAVYNVNK